MWPTQVIILCKVSVHWLIKINLHTVECVCACVGRIGLPVGCAGSGKELRLLLSLLLICATKPCPPSAYKTLPCEGTKG